MTAHAQYEAIPAMNWSTLKHLAVSPRLLRHRLEHPRPDTGSLRLGRAIHCAILEPDRWARGYVVEPEADRRTREGRATRAEWLVRTAQRLEMPGAAALVPQPDFGDGRSKAAREAHSAWRSGLSPDVRIVVGTEAPAEIFGEHVEVVSAAEFELAERLATTVREHPAAADLADVSRAEEVVTWTDPITGVACKGRLDIGRTQYVLDLKSTRRPTLREIGLDFCRYLYHGQLGFYHDGAVSARVIPPDAPPPRVLVVQTVEPYDVIPGYLGRRDLELGRDLYRSLLTRYLECEAADWWPGLAPEPVEIPMPEWTPGAPPAGDEEDW